MRSDRLAAVAAGSREVAEVLLFTPIETKGDIATASDAIAERLMRLYEPLIRDETIRYSIEVPLGALWQGTCGHHWDYRDHGEECPICSIHARMVAEIRGMRDDAKRERDSLPAADIREDPFAYGVGMHAGGRVVGLTEALLAAEESTDDSH